jgi:hypothetical protein
VNLPGEWPISPSYSLPQLGSLLRSVTRLLSIYLLDCMLLKERNGELLIKFVTISIERVLNRHLSDGVLAFITVTIT